MIYILLTLVGLTGAAIAVLKSDRRAELAAVFVCAAAVIMLADWIAFGWFDLYRYRPNLLPNPIADGALGELLADILFVPSLCLVLLRFTPGLTGIVLGTVIVSTVEYLFLKIGLFEHHGWALWYSTVGFVVYFAALDLVWHDLRRQLLPPAYFRVILRSSLLFDLIALLSLFLRGNQLVVTNVSIMPTYIGNQALGRFISYVLVVVPPAYWVLSGGQRWLRLLALTAGLMLMNYLLTAFNIQHFVPPWNVPLDSLAQGVAVALAGLLEDLITGASSDPRVRRLV